jgi:DNA-binding MarR family transcriptional regulator
LGYRLRLAQQAVFRDFARSIPDLSPGRVGVLVLIESNPGVTQSRLARAVGLDRSTLVGLLHRLEGRALIQRRRGTDRRTNGLWLTPKGAALLGRTKPLIAIHEDRVAARLSARERERLLVLLGKLLG